VEENAPMALDEVPTNVRRKIPNLLRMQVLYDRDSLVVMTATLSGLMPSGMSMKTPFGLHWSR